MAKTNILSRLGGIVASITGKKPERPDQQATGPPPAGGRALEGPDTPDNARAITAALKSLEEGSQPGQQAISFPSPSPGKAEKAPPPSPAGSKPQEQRVSPDAEESKERKKGWLATNAESYKEKSQAARAAIARAGTGRRPSREEGMKETEGLSVAERKARLEQEGMPPVEQQGQETPDAALERSEDNLLDRREEENKALESGAGMMAKFGKAVGGPVKTLMKLDLAVRGVLAGVEKWTDGLMASKENLAEYNGVVAQGMAEQEASERQLLVERGQTTQSANASFMRQKKGFSEAMGPINNSMEIIVTRVAAVVLFFGKWLAKFYYLISPITYIAKGVEVISNFFGWGGEEAEPPAVLYMQFLQMVADGKFEGPHTARPEKK